LAGKKSKDTELAVLKGRKPDLTRAILLALSREALVKYDVHKAMVKLGFKDTNYGTIKKRILILEETGYVKQVGIRKTQPGSEGILYEATFKAMAALEQNRTDQDELFELMDEVDAMEFVAFLARIRARKS
jgi:DNA-binding PadR family transcriptional regulator